MKPHKHFSAAQVIELPAEYSLEANISRRVHGRSLGWLVQSCDVFRPGPFECEFDGLIFTFSEPIFDEPLLSEIRELAIEQELYDSEFYHSRYFKERTVRLKDE